MLKGSQALMAAIESGSPVPTNEKQVEELGRQFARDTFGRGNRLIDRGNKAFDAAARDEWSKLEAGTQAKHTPGPWHVLDGAVLCEGINAYGNWHICRFDRCEQPNTAEDNANARLIAAAPELLEALGNLIHHAERDIDEMDDLADCEEAEEEVRDARLALKLAYAAIAKAGGAK